ncbi:uncharacterized protein LOC143847269 [Tasmannia lanceolata]|uniref:uncharacterized protein LOC143847269 n=1 Tax=Tasmannia lanceolata TaxID=3420 RepID=UPI004062C9B1
MGSCFSSETKGSITLSTAKVISLKGALREYLVPVNVSQVLYTESTSCFLCNADKLYFDDYIRALDHGEQLQLGQIYFVLPIIRLKYPLTASDMAALAIKASLALTQGPKKSGRRKKIRISPVLDVSQAVNFDGYLERDSYHRSIESIVYQLPKHDSMCCYPCTRDDHRNLSPSKSSGLSRSGSVRKLQRTASRQAKMAYRSFRARLSTIHEGSVIE